LPAAFLLLLVLPFHPYWLDFELARRGLLLVGCGGVVALALRERALLPPPLESAASRWLLAFLAWMAIAAAAHASTLSPWDAVYRLAYGAAFLVLLRLGPAFPAHAWLRPICWLLVATSLYGLLQRLGLAEWSGYGTPGEPVSVFGNLNVAAEFTAVAVAATIAFGLQAPRPAAAALFLAGAYLAVNGSRSGLWAAPLGALAVLALAGNRWPHVLALLLALLLGAGAGIGVRSFAVDPGKPKTAQGTTATPQERTLQVREEIWKSCLHMAADAPLLGTGPGQFQVQYPRYRSQREIELSSHDREFATEAGTAHDDWLEILVEGGVPGLLLWLGFFATMLWRARRAPHAFAPLLALGALMFVRAPLGNAPAAAIALLLAGTAGPPAPDGARRWPWLAADAVVGVALLVLGALPILANCALIPYQRAKSRFEKGAPGLEQAATFDPFLPYVWQLLAQERQPDTADRARFESALAAADRAVALRPHEPSFLLLRAELLMVLGRYDEARTDIDAATALDPGDPVWRIRRSTLAFLEGDHEAAIAVCWDHPHHRLLEQLPEHFAGFERKLREKKDPWAERYAAERAFATALLALPNKDPVALSRTSRLVTQVKEAFFQAGLKSSDARPWWLLALHCLDIGQREAAENLAQSMLKLQLEVPQWQRDLMGAAELERLRALPGWATILH
jgi:O-antigen ligase/tetratricopeptide (TPR) repeat protein